MNPRLEIEYRELLVRKRRLQTRRLPPEASQFQLGGREHGYRFHLGEDEVQAGSPEGRAVRALIADPCKLADWKPVKAAGIATSKKPGQAGLKLLHASGADSQAVTCTRHSASVDRCMAPGYDVGYLQRTARQAGSGGGIGKPPAGKQARSHP